MLTQTTNYSSTQSIGRNARVAVSASSHELTGSLEMMGAPMSFSPQCGNLRENEPAEYLYKLISGTVRTSKIP
jgi:hypothetical protein